MTAIATSRPANIDRAMMRGTTWLSISSVGVGVVNYAYALVLTHLLGLEDYRIFAAGQSVLLVVGVVAGSATPWVLAREMARVGDDRLARAQAVRFSLLLNVALGSVVTAGAFAVSVGFGSIAEATAVAGSAGLIVLASSPLGWWQGSLRFRAIAGARLLEVGLKAGLGVVFAAAGFGAAGAIGAFAFGAVGVLVLGLLPMLADLRVGSGMRFDRALWRSAFGISSAQGLVAVLASADVIVVAMLQIDNSDASAYQASMIVARVPLYLAAALSMSAFPVLSASRSQGPLVGRSVRTFVRLLVPLTLVLVFVPSSVLSVVFPDTFGTVAGWLSFTAVAGAMIGFVQLGATLLQATGASGRCIALLLPCVLLHVTALIVGFEIGGLRGLAFAAVGGASATALALAVELERTWTGAVSGAASDWPLWLFSGCLLAATRHSSTLWVGAAIVVLVAAIAKTIMPGRDSGHLSRRGPDSLHILHLGFEDFRRPGSGGGAVRTHEINKRLVAAGHHVTVLTTKWRGAVDRTEDGVSYVHIGFGHGYMPSILSYFAVLPFHAARRDCDLIVEDFAAPFSSALTPLWTRRPTIAMVQWLNAREKSRQYKLPFFLIERLGVRAHRRFIAVSSDLADKIRAGNPAAVIAVVPNGVDLVEPDLAAARQLTGSVRQRCDIVFLGRLEIAQKGLDFLVEAYAAIAEHTDADLIIAGNGQDAGRLASMAEERGLGDRVRFVGRVEGVAKSELLARAAVVAMPSRFETFGMVAVEALASGAPVVAFEIPCLREVVPSSCGVLVEAFDVDEFAHALLALVEDESRRVAMGGAGRDFAARFDWDVIADKQVGHYFDCVRS